MSVSLSCSLSFDLPGLLYHYNLCTIGFSCALNVGATLVVALSHGHHPQQGDHKGRPYPDIALGLVLQPVYGRCHGAVSPADEAVWASMTALSWARLTVIWRWAKGWR